jgi:hypothetical protein
VLGLVLPESAREQGQLPLALKLLVPQLRLALALQLVALVLAIQ